MDGHHTPSASPMSGLAVHIEGLSKRYRTGTRAGYGRLTESIWEAGRRLVRRSQKPSGEEVWALRDVDLDISAGEVVGFVGRNGAGKTTLLKILSRITEPTCGYVDLKGRVGCLLEVGTGFHPELTGRENIYLNGAILGMRRAEIARKFDEIVGFCEIDKYLDTPVKRYSSGMYVRLAFAVAAHLEPEILIVDEVLAVGDVAFQRKCLGKMSQVAEGGRTVLFVTHQMMAARRLCTRAVWLNSGKLQMAGETGKVIAAYEASLADGSEDTGRSRDTTHFISWDVVSPRSDEPNVLESAGPATFRFRVWAHEAVAKARFGVVLWNADGVLVWSWAQEGFSLHAGINEIRISVPSLPVRPGVYTWEAAVLAGQQSLDRWHGIPPMIVATEPVVTARDGLTGLLNLPAAFDVSAAGDPA